MLGIPCVTEFTNHVYGIDNSLPESMFELLKLYQRANVIAEDFENTVQEILLPLQFENKIYFLRHVLDILVYDNSGIFSGPEWWVKECIRNKPAEYLLEGDLDEVARFIGLPNKQLADITYSLALNAAGRDKFSAEKIEKWSRAYSEIKSLESLLHSDLSEIEEEDLPSKDHFPDGMAICHMSVISIKIYKRAIRRIASHLSYLREPSQSFTARPELEWRVFDETESSDLIVELASEEYRDNEAAMKLRAELAEARDNVRRPVSSDNVSNNSVQESPNKLQIKWLGSKTELAELGYALLEAQLIGGPREASLRSLSTFFGQDLGNPAKHLQTLQKRKWDALTKEPTTPLIDKLRVALRDYLKGNR